MTKMYPSPPPKANLEGPFEKSTLNTPLLSPLTHPKGLKFLFISNILHSLVPLAQATIASSVAPTLEN